MASVAFFKFQKSHPSNMKYVVSNTILVLELAGRQLPRGCVVGQFHDCFFMYSTIGSPPVDFSASSFMMGDGLRVSCSGKTLIFIVWRCQGEIEMKLPAVDLSTRLYSWYVYVLCSLYPNIPHATQRILSIFSMEKSRARGQVVLGIIGTIAFSENLMSGVNPTTPLTASS